MNLTDLHNRRGNIALVSKRAKENGFPFLTWPEYRQLLRLADLPVINGIANRPPAWRAMITTATFTVHSDEQLREAVKIGRAYAVTTVAQQLSGTQIVEYKVKS